MELKTCENCQKRIGINDKECPYCKHIYKNIILEEIKTEKAKEKNQIIIKYCPKCGKTIEKNDRYCSNCGSELGNVNDLNFQTNMQIVENIEQVNDGKKYILGWLFSLMSSFIVDIISNLLDKLDIGYSLISVLTSISALLKIISIIVIITGKIKIPQNKVIKVIFWVYITLIILTIIFYIIALIFTTLAIVACVSEIQNCPG